MRWTCGPFKEADDRCDKFGFRMLQQHKLLEMLESIEKVDTIAEQSDLEEQAYIALLKLELEQKFEVLLGVGNGQSKDSEIP